LEISRVSGYDGHAVDKRRRGDKRIVLGTGIGDMQLRAALRDGGIDREDAA
jgi:hypothetical protein